MFPGRQGIQLVKTDSIKLFLNMAESCMSFYQELLLLFDMFPDRSGIQLVKTNCIKQLEVNKCRV